MANVTVYFATNRKKDAGQYGSSSVTNDPAAATYAVADVTGVTLGNADAGNIKAIHDENAGEFSHAVKSQIIGADRNLLIFIHGADNSFDDAIKRAAFNREWFAASGKVAADTTVLAFTWPSSNKYFAPGHNPRDEYLADQVQAGKSNFHLALFLKAIDKLRGDFLAAHPGRQIFLLAHSMGNLALQGAVQGWFDGHGPNDLIFDHALLAAPDEVRNSFESPHGGHFSKLPNLTRRISVYYNRADFLMLLSEAVNHNMRLGFNGPEHKFDAAKYPPSKFRLVDCTEVYDYWRVGESSHQYYRKSEKVRGDIVACMVNNPPPDGGNIELLTPPGAPEPGGIA
jgi:esterase/lipase superfamily enzyme